MASDTPPPVYICVALAILSAVVGADDNETVRVVCRFGKPSRKQIEAQPLEGTCLRDIVDRFSRTLRAIGNDELGVTIFQEKLDRLEFADISVGLDAELRRLVEKSNSKLNSYAELLRKSNDVIQPILPKKQNRAVYPGQTVRLDSARSKVPDICSRIVDALATNLRGQEWKHLHVLPVSQPGTMCGPPSLAHNIGPLLLSQCGRSKKVILLLEHGPAMTEGDLVLAQMTAKTVVDMLSDTDYVTVVGLAGRGTTHCAEGLSRATDMNKYQLARHIDGITRSESNETLDVDFKTMTENLTGEVVLVHLTNAPKDASSVKRIVDEITSEKLIPRLRTIVILSEPRPRVDAEEISKNGSVITLPTQNVLGYEIARLFSGLECSDDEKKDYYVSDPYFEPYSKTMTFSVGRITSTTLLSLDVKLKDFLEDVTYFDVGPSSHAILFDKKEVVWMHATFPRMETMTEQPLKVYLRDIENIDGQVARRMTEEPRGVVQVRTKLGSMKKYRWRRLSYEDLIVCVVSEKEGHPLPVVKSPLPLPPNILHHRLDLTSQSIVGEDTLCAYRNRIATLGTGVVYLSPWCFQSPNEQLKLLEAGSAVTVQSYMAYIKDSTGLLTNPGLNPSVRPDVATLAQILNHFKQRHAESPLGKYIARRYVVSTVSGVLELYPGTVIDSGLDPKRRAWYGKALEHPGKIVLTTPYLDAGGAGYVVTVSHTVHEGRAASLHSSGDPVLAVMSMDLTLGYVSRLLSEMLPFCADERIKCFLMDDTGYLISHPSFLDPGVKVEQQHLTHKEFLVANDILNHEFFVKKKICASHLDGTTQRYYQFNTSLEEVLTNIVHGEHCVKYQVAAVPGTNVFLGVVNVTCSLLAAFCPCSTMDRLCLNCKRMEQTECECPCECSLYPAGCARYNASRMEPCRAPYERGPTLQAPWARSTALKSCPYLDCKAYANVGECLGVVGCQWCHVDGDATTPLRTPFCSDKSVCFKGVLGSPYPYGDGTYDSHSTEEMTTREWPSVGPVAGGILAFVLVLGVTLFCYRLRTVQSGLEHQCLHLHASPDTLRMSHLEGDAEPMELDQAKGNLDSLLRDGVAPISPYRVSTNYRRPPGGDSDHGYSTMTPHDDSEQQTFAEPLLIVGGGTDRQPDLVRQTAVPPSPTTHLGSPHRVLAPVTVHRDMETNYC